jgi:hypothetical protein
MNAVTARHQPDRQRSAAVLLEALFEAGLGFCWPTRHLISGIIDREAFAGIVGNLQRAFQVRPEAFEAIAKETKMAGEIGWGLSDEIDCTSGRGNPHRNPRPAKLDPVRGCFVRDKESPRAYATTGAPGYSMAIEASCAPSIRARRRPGGPRHQRLRSPRANLAC